MENVLLSVGSATSYHISECWDIFRIHISSTPGQVRINCFGGAFNTAVITTQP